MDTSALKLRYERTPDFFTFLHYQSDEPFVFCSEDETGELTGVAALTVREGLVNGELKRIGYLADLRVKREKQTREFAKIWKACMGEIIANVKTIPELRCDYLITAIMAGNKKAKKALVNQPKNEFHYEKLCNYQMVNLVTTFGKQNPDPRIKVSRCQSLDEIMPYWIEQNKNRPFAYTPEFVQKALNQWKGLTPQHFLKVEKEGKVIGACAVWNPSPIKKIVIERLPWSLKLLNTIASLFTKTPREHQELKVQYLNFLTVDEENALYAMIDFLKKEGVFKHYHLLAFADYEQCSYLKGLKLAIKDNTPLELYQVVPKTHMHELIPIESSIPGFEISLV
jgi:hypothetical protein